jgi:hypothetical protein
VWGKQEYLVQVAQQLCWLSATFRTSREERVTYSYSVLEVVNQPPPEKPMPAFKISLAPLQPVAKPSCWYAMFPGRAIAGGFPIPTRQNNEEGIELSLNFMLTTGLVQYSQRYMDTDGAAKVVLKGDYTALVPISRCGDSVQWHFISNEKTAQRISTDDIVDECSKILPCSDLNTLLNPELRYFIGLFENATLNLATPNSGFSYMQYSTTAKPNTGPRMSREASLSITIIPKYFSGTIKGHYPRPERARIESGKLSFESKLNLAQENVTIFYDEALKRAWLVPEISAIHHLLLFSTSKDPESAILLPRIPLATVCADGDSRQKLAESKARIFREACGEKKALLVYEAFEEMYNYFSALKDSVNERKDEMISVQQSGIVTGWDVESFRRKDGERLKLSIASNTAGDWPTLTNSENVVTILGRNLGTMIKAVEDGESCQYWSPLDHRHHYLITTVPCIVRCSQLARATKGCPKLGESLFCERSRDSYLFEDCPPASSCSRLQRLSHTQPRHPLDLQEAPQGLVIFGARILQKNQPSCRELTEGAPRELSCD